MTKKRVNVLLGIMTKYHLLLKYFLIERYQFNFDVVIKILSWLLIHEARERSRASSITQAVPRI